MSTLTDILGMLEGGMTLEGLNERLREIVQSVRQTGKAGEIVLSVKVRPNGRDAFTVDPVLKVKLPEVIAEGTSLVVLNGKM